MAAFALAFGLWYVVRVPYGRLLVTVADPVLVRIEGDPVEEAIRWRDGRFELVTRLARRPGGPPHAEEFTSAVHQTHRGLILFIGVLLATPWATLRRRGWWVPVAGLLVFATHAGALTLSAFTTLGLWHGLRGFPFHDIETVETCQTVVMVLDSVLLWILPVLYLAPLWVPGLRALIPEAGTGSAGAPPPDPGPPSSPAAGSTS